MENNNEERKFKFSRQSCKLLKEATWLAAAAALIEDLLGRKEPSYFDALLQRKNSKQNDQFDLFDRSDIYNYEKLITAYVWTKWAQILHLHVHFPKNITQK